MSGSIVTEPILFNSKYSQKHSCTCGARIYKNKTSCGQCESGLIKSCEVQTCTECDEAKSIDDFHIVKSTGYRYKICKKCHHEKARLSQVKTKKAIVAALGSSCAICKDGSYIHMDLHHVDPNEKEVDIGSFKGSSAFEQVDELSKCVLLCSNHHVEVHAGLHDDFDFSLFQKTSDEIRSSLELSLANRVKTETNCIDCHGVLRDGSIRCRKCFNQYLAEQKAIRKQEKVLAPKVTKVLKIKVENKCLDCSKKVTLPNSRCMKCAKSSQPTKIIWPSTEELEEKLKTMSYIALSKELGVSDNAIRKRIKNHSRTKAGSVAREVEV